jgi:hypothetical protein
MSAEALEGRLRVEQFLESSAFIRSGPWVESWCTARNHPTLVRVLAPFAADLSVPILPGHAPHTHARCLQAPRLPMHIRHRSLIFHLVGTVGLGLHTVVARHVTLATARRTGRRSPVCGSKRMCKRQSIDMVHDSFHARLDGGTERWICLRP